MIKYYEGTIFNVNVDAIVNTVNTSGYMGAGLALEVSLRYPKMYEDYKLKCKNKIITIGKMDYFKANDITIVNFPTKCDFKMPSRISWVEEGLKNFVFTYSKHNIKSIAFPKLGSLNGGLNWFEVKILMETYLNNLDIDVYICLDNLKHAEGKELDMVTKFNNYNIDELSSSLKLNYKIKNSLQRIKPVSRFYKIGLAEGIGKQTYKKLFDYFYNSEKHYIQPKLL